MNFLGDVWDWLKNLDDPRIMLIICAIGTILFYSAIAWLTQSERTANLVCSGIAILLNTIVIFLR